jgi:hexosaminidase
MKYFFYVLAAAGCFLNGCKPKTPTDLTKEILIPKPVSVTATNGSFEIDPGTKIYFNGGDAAKTVAIDLLAYCGLNTTQNLIATTEIPSAGIYLTTQGKDVSLSQDGYQLSITEDLLTISAPSGRGLFYGVQTLRQLLPVEPVPGKLISIPTGTIQDYPRYKWRGSMLDVARHFFGVADVKRYIDLISSYKMNILHLHLSDDQGWRIEIKSWPNLTKTGGSTQVGGGNGGFYTQEQYAEIVQYARDRYVTIVPEIDLPGHINSALASYGELNGGTIVPTEGAVKPLAENVLGQKNKPTSLYTGTEVGWSTLRYEKEATFKFINDVIHEISAITPDPYFHIGGDEAAATRKEDYVKFIDSFVKITAANNKTMIGWEEIAQGAINSNVITQYWRSPEHALAAVDKGSKIIMSPATKAYLDMTYDSTTRLGLHWAAYIEVDDAYNWDPGTQVNGISDNDILGVEAPLWSETISTMDEIEFLAFPRLPGYAEIGWSPQSARNWDEYKLRLAAHGKRMEATGIDFYRSPRVPWK